MPSISPENWSYLPISPKFGSLIDVSGGRAKGEDTFEKKQVETSRGLMFFLMEGENLIVRANDLGVALRYDKDGNLSDLGMDINNYCAGMGEEEFQKMGGDALADMLSFMDGAGDRMLFSVDLEDKWLAIVRIDKSGGNAEMLFSETDVDLKQSSIISLDYHGYIIEIGIQHVDDELMFGMRLVDPDDEFGGGKMMVMKVISECNFQTFIKSESPERFELLAKRIFI